MATSGRAKEVLGWHEVVALPGFGIESAFAKLDTGSDHSVLHARNVSLLAGGRVEFTLPLLLKQARCSPFESGGPRRVSSQLADERIVRSSNGSEEVRYVIETELRLSGEVWSVRFSLTDRKGMRFPILLGRSALKNHILVDSERAHLSADTPACDFFDEE